MSHSVFTVGTAAKPWQAAQLSAGSKHFFWPSTFPVLLPSLPRWQLQD